ncbi:MAG: DUF4832 domain-containing protein [Flavobacteriales bacterium]
MKNLILFLSLSASISYGQISQNGTSLHITYEGLAPDMYSPFYQGVWATHGLHNPDRGFEIKAGVIDVFTEDFATSIDPNIDDFEFPQFQLKGANFYQNIDNPSSNLTQLPEYLQHHYCNDGISLVEVEEYMHFTEANLQSNTPSPLNQDHLEGAEDIFNHFERLGLKSHLVLNSSFKLFFGGPPNGTNSYYSETGAGNANYSSSSSNFDQYYIYDPVDGTIIGIKDLGKVKEQDILFNQTYASNRITNMTTYFESLNPHFSTLSPFVSNVHLGWISSPWDRNTYRHSSKWQKNTFTYDYFEKGYNNFTTLNDYHNTAVNEWGDYRQNSQKFDWNVAHTFGDGWHYRATADLNAVRQNILYECLDAFEDQKILTNSIYPWTNFAGRAWCDDNTAPSVNNLNGLFGDIHNHFYQASSFSWVASPYSGFTKAQSTSGEIDPNGVPEHRFLRVGNYDGFFTPLYNLAWSIGNGNTQLLHWHNNYYNAGLGTDWVGKPIATDSYTLRKFRQQFWMHGELPVYESPESFTAKYGGEWTGNFLGLGNQYAFQPQLESSAGTLSLNPFYYALKMRYFNYTSFNISHNNLLDGRSPYEMQAGNTRIAGWDNQTFAPLDARRTIVNQWKAPDVNLRNLLIQYKMPIAFNYFGYPYENQTRSLYEYIRDHLGYRLQLRAGDFSVDQGTWTFKLDVRNAGFAAPQNPRPFYFVILDAETNEIIETIETNAEWRHWQPDAFARSIQGETNVSTTTGGNVETGPTDSLANTKVGGLPLGENSDPYWFQTPLNINNEVVYHQIEAQFTPSADYESGVYKIGLWSPDPNPSLADNPLYALKFANQNQYLVDKGITILAKLNLTANNVYVTDADADGTSDNQDLHPFNPVDYNGAINLNANHPDNGLQNQSAVEALYPLFVTPCQ